LTLQIMLFSQFLGTNGFYHLLRDARGVSTAQVCRTVRQVAEALMPLMPSIIRWPEDCSKLATLFHRIGGFPLVAGAIDGTHVLVSPPGAQEEACLNRHQSHSLNVLAVAGPDLSYYYAFANQPGRCHDSSVLKASNLFEDFENGWQPFDNAHLLGDLGYPLMEWLLTPYPGNFF
jgi:hypothetical protein